jgi:hypothetical protein
MVAGDDAAATDLEVEQPAGPHLVVQQIPGEPGDLRDLVHRVSKPFSGMVLGESGHISRVGYPLWWTAE